MDTAEPLPPSLDPDAGQRLAKSGEAITTDSRSLVLLRRLA